MGKATIVSGGEEGKYQVKLDYGQDVKTARLAAIDVRLAELIGLITQALQDLNLQEYTSAQMEADVEAAVNAYVATAQVLATQGPDADPIVFKALQDAVKNTLKDHTQALAKLAEAIRKTAPLKLAWRALKDEQVQLQKDRTKWDAMVLEENVQAWCADLTEDAKGEVATVEIPGENKLVLLAPAAPAPDATHGVLAAREVQSPEQVFFNAAILPGWQKYKPTYRRGVITAIKLELDQVSVTLEATDKSSAQNLVINQAETLVDVPVKYMTCNAAAFEVGDKCVVMFKDQDWAKPEVVGFVDNPKPCGFVLSGVVRSPTAVLLPVPEGAPPGTVGKPALSSYKPTANAWQYPLRSNPAKSPSAYHDEALLGAAAGQYGTVRASMYSGLMAKVVQVVLGAGLPVAYDYRFTRCHGVALAADGKPWLIEISQVNGVLARPFTIARSGKNSRTEAEAACFEIFGGVPGNKAFDSGATLAAQIAEGKVRQLIDPDGMLPFFEKSPYSSAMGWSFSPSGHEAHNTCMTRVHPYARGYHYKLAITVGAAPAATLSLVSDGPFLYRGDGKCRFAFYQPGSTTGMIDAPDSYTDAAGTDDTGASAPLLVCHIDGVLDVVRYRHGPTARDVSTIGPTGIPGVTAETGAADRIITRAHYVTSERHSFEGGTREQVSKSLGTRGGPAGWQRDPRFTGGQYQDFRYVTTTYYFVLETGTSTSNGLSAGLWPGDTRDAYVFYRSGVLSYTSERRSFVGAVDTVGSVITPTTELEASAIPNPAYPTAGNNSPLVAGVDSYLRLTMTQGIPGNQFNGDQPSPPAMKAELPSGETIELSLADLPPGTDWLDPVRARPAAFKLQASMFGPNAASAISLPRDPALLTLAGAPLAGEATPSNTVYNFVGYL